MSKLKIGKLIRHCQRTDGAKAEVLRRLNAAGVISNWATVSSWLHPDPDKRREPRSDNAEALLKVQGQMCK